MRWRDEGWRAGVRVEGLGGRRSSLPAFAEGEPTNQSGTRDSNSRHPAWEAGTLPTELVPQSEAVVPLTLASVNDARLPRLRSGTEQKRNGPRLATWAVPVLRRRRERFGFRGVGPHSRGKVTGASTWARYVRSKARARDQRSRLVTTSAPDESHYVFALLFPPPAYRHPRAQRSRPPPRAGVSLGVSR